MESHHMSRILALSVLILGLAGLTACGPGGGDEQGEDQSVDSVADELTTDDVADMADEMAGLTAEENEMADEPAVTAEDLPGTADDGATPTPTSAMTHDAEDTGEDLFQRGFYPEAMAQWRQDAEAGNAYAAYRLGVEYFDGNVVERDVEEAARYQQLSSELGNPAAMFELASFYESGLGVDQSISEAASWYLESARRGYPPAQHNLATMYEDGEGLEQDLVQAYVYYSLAIEQGFRVNFVQDEESGETTFVDPRDRLADEMTDEQMEAARVALADWTPVE